MTLRLIVAASLLFCSTGSFAKIKNVIFIIGDGMGFQQLSLGESYLRYAKQSSFDRKHLFMTTMANEGSMKISYTSPVNAVVVDSACSANQLALGVDSLSETIGLDQNGNKADSIMTMAKSANKSVGLISDTRSTHATIAAFYGHTSHRSMENELAEMAIESQADLILSGGIRNYLPKEVNDKKSPEYQKALDLIKNPSLIKSKRKDSKNLIQVAKTKKWNVVFDKNQLQNQSSNQQKTLGLFTSSGMPDGIWYTKNQNKKDRSIPTLEEMTDFALKKLSKNKDGFFLMIEAGQIDWAGHQNDTGLMLHQMLHADNMMKQVYEFAKKNKETLVVITADHETGSFGFSYKTTNLPKPKKVNGNGFLNGELFSPKNNFMDFNLLDKIYAQDDSILNITNDFLNLPKKKRTGKELCERINNISVFKLTLDECKGVLKATKSVKKKNKLGLLAWKMCRFDKNSKKYTMLVRRQGTHIILWYRLASIRSTLLYVFIGL